MGIPQISTPNSATPQDKARAREVAQNMRANEKAYHELPMGFKIEFLDTHANTLKDCKEMIDHHDREISKAFLAQFIELGAQQSGSYALSANQSKLFLLGLEYIAKIIQEEVNKAIKELCDLNFPNLKEEDYPTLEYGAIGEVDYTTLSDALSKLSTAGIITPTLEMEKYILNTTKIPVSEELDEIWEEKREQAAQLLTQPLAPTDEGTKPSDDKKAKLPNKSMQPGRKGKIAEDEEPEDKKLNEFMDDILKFHEELVSVIESKENHATTV
jgi:phage gp29-like protein